ncbi:MAG: cysteine hydrolase family protein [Planctomycetota bacterium]|jgi:nicotinamidase-related amidase
MGAEFKAENWTKRILIDICTQHDFLDAGAILQVANRETLIPILKEVFQWARTAQVPIVSSVESHRAAEPVNGFPLHCIDGTEGQKKLDFTLLEPWAAVETDNYLSLPPDLRKNYRQLIFRKRTREVLSNPKADRFLTQLNAKQFIIFGVGLERTIRSLALGLMARKKNVAVISNACGSWSPAEADLAIRQLATKGIRPLTVEELTTQQPAQKQHVAKRRLVQARYYLAKSTRQSRNKING